jgi:hypothetical protein
MTPEQFAYWLHGFVELGKGAAPTAEQWKSIREHLDTVFKKVTPAVGDEPKKVESDLARSLREFSEKQAQQQQQQAFPYYPQQQPYWLGTGIAPGIAPYTFTC